MGRFIVRRLLASVPVLFLVSLITFGLLWLVPGDPASIFLDASATAEALEEVVRFTCDRLGVERATMGLMVVGPEEATPPKGAPARGGAGTTMVTGRSGQPCWECAGVASAATFVAGGLLAARLASQGEARASGLVLGIYYGGRDYETLFSTDVN